MTKVFVSYCHAQGEWVWDRLVPVLKAGGAEVLIDRERFEAGKAIFGQMDAVQDQAERQLLVLSPEYLASKAVLARDEAGDRPRSGFQPGHGDPRAASGLQAAQQHQTAESAVCRLA